MREGFSLLYLPPSVWPSRCAASAQDEPVSFDAAPYFRHPADLSRLQGGPPTLGQFLRQRKSAGPSRPWHHYGLLTNTRIPPFANPFGWNSKWLVCGW